MVNGGETMSQTDCITFVVVDLALARALLILFLGCWLYVQWIRGL